MRGLTQVHLSGAYKQTFDTLAQGTRYTLTFDYNVTAERYSVAIHTGGMNVVAGIMLNAGRDVFKGVRTPVGALFAVAAPNDAADPTRDNIESGRVKVFLYDETV